LIPYAKGGSVVFTGVDIRCRTVAMLRKAALALGLTISQSLLLRADEVIE